MSKEDQQAKSKKRRIENLRRRLQQLGRPYDPQQLGGLLLGILDLLADEL